MAVTIDDCNCEDLDADLDVYLKNGDVVASWGYSRCSGPPDDTPPWFDCFSSTGEYNTTGKLDAMGCKFMSNGGP